MEHTAIVSRRALASSSIGKGDGGSNAIGSSGDAARLKKERRNERDRQRSHLKRESVKQMKQIVEELEATKRQLLARSSSSTTSHSSSGLNAFTSTNTSYHHSDSKNFTDGSHSPVSPISALTQQASLSPTSKIQKEDFVRLTEQIELLRFENAALTRDLHERDLFNSAMQHLLLDFQKNQSSDDVHHRQRELIGFTPLTSDEVASFAEQALRQFRKARFDHVTESHYTSTAKVFGWSDFRVRQGSTITFSVKKLLTNAHPTDMIDSVWDICTDTSKIGGLLPPDVKCELRVLQRVSDNILIIDRRTTTSERSPQLVLRTVLMVFRVHNFDGNGDVVIMKTMDSPLVKNLLLPDEMWCDIFYYWRFESGRAPPRDRDPDRDQQYESEQQTDTLAEFGGILTYVREEIASAWLAELLFLAIRWETIAVRPVLLKAS